MRLAKIPTGNGKAVSLTFDNFRGRTLIECHEPAALLSHLSDGALVPTTASGTYLRGVILPDEDAIFELFDESGSSCRTPIRFPREAAKSKVLDAMICRVRE